jgi:hypothetical protein
MGQEEIIEKAAETYEVRQAIHTDLERTIPQVKEAVLSLFGEIEKAGSTDGLSISKTVQAAGVQQA